MRHVAYGPQRAPRHNPPHHQTQDQRCREDAGVNPRKAGEDFLVRLERRTDGNIERRALRGEVWFVEYHAIANQKWLAVLADAPNEHRGVRLARRQSVAHPFGDYGWRVHAKIFVNRGFGGGIGICAIDNFIQRISPLIGHQIDLLQLRYAGALIQIVGIVIPIGFEGFRIGEPVDVQIALHREPLLREKLLRLIVQCLA